MNGHSPLESTPPLPECTDVLLPEFPAPVRMVASLAGGPATEPAVRAIATALLDAFMLQCA